MDNVKFSMNHEFCSRERDPKCITRVSRAKYMAAELYRLHTYDNNDYFSLRLLNMPSLFCFDRLIRINRKFMALLVQSLKIRAESRYVPSGQPR